MSALSGPVPARLSLPSIERSTLLLIPLLAVLAFVVLYPTGTILLNGVFVSQPGGGTRVAFDAWQSVLSRPGMAPAILNTLQVVLTVQLISFPIAIVISWLLARTDVPASRWLEFGFWVSFLLPALGTTTGWLLFLAPDYGLVNQFLVKNGFFQTPPFDMYSFWGIVFAHLATYSISVKVMLMTPAFRNLSGALEEASRVCGASGLGTLVRVVVPVLTPALVVTFLMSLIRALEAFEIELILGARTDFSVYSTKIYQLLRGSPPDYASAAVLATIVLGLMLPLIVFQWWASTRRSYITLTGQHQQTVLQLGAWRWLVFTLLVLTVILLTIVPITLQVLGSLMNLFGFFDVPQVWTLRHWERAFADVTFTRGLLNTIVLGTGTALMAVFGYAVVAYCSVRLRTSWRSALDILSWLPFTIPGVLLGLGYLWMILQVPVFRPLYGTIGVLILVSWLAAMTLGVQALKSALLQLGFDVEEAGRVVGGSWAQVVRDIVAPLSAPAMAVVAVMIFAITVRQVSTLVLLATGPTAPLALLQLEYLYGAELGPAAVVGTLIVLLSLAAAAIVSLIAARYGVGRR
jgi:iron(III) transport system permease protein